MWHFTSSYYKIQQLKSKVRIVQGGQGAGKNVAIAQILIQKAIEKKCLITICSDTYDNLRDGSIKDFQFLFENSDGVLNWDRAFNKNESDLHIKGSVIQFRYISDVKRQAGKSKRRDILYLNEGNKIGWEVASTYIGRTHEEVYIDFNPDEEFWGHTEVPKLKNEKGESISSQIIVTFRDNEMCPQSEIDYIESRKDNESWYRVYGLGLTGYYSERRILNYQFCDAIPGDAVKQCSVMDFGVSPDPTILIDLYLKDNKLYANERFCMNNLMPEKIKGAERMSIVDKMKEIGFPKGQMIIGDSAARSSIVDLSKHGYNIHGVVKHPGDVIEGLRILRGYTLYLTRNSVNIKQGIESFFWKVDRNGKIIPEPDGHEPDGIAAIRYGVMTFGRKTGIRQVN